MPENKIPVWVKRISIILAIAVMIYFTMMTVIIPVSRFRIVVPDKIPGYDKVLNTDLNWVLTVNDSVKNEAHKLISTEAYLLSRLEMAKSDSISLSISLKDSTISLLIQGVTIYSSRIESFSVSTALKKADPFTLAVWLSQPFAVVDHYSSIPKVPVMHKKAPKDTIEAMNQLVLDPLKDESAPVFFRLYMDRQLTLNIKQSGLQEGESTKPLKTYKKLIKSTERKNILKHLVRFTPVDFVPEINIVLDKKAARVIYRAIPHAAQVSVQLPEK